MSLLVVKNVAANLFARVWMAGLQFIFAPLYLHLLGANSYGLVGFYSSLLLALLFLDQAVSPVLTRELARLSRAAGGAQEARNMLRTLEQLSFSIAVFLGFLIWALAPYIASNWIHGGGISEDRVTTVVRLMGLTITCQWPAFLYNAGFVGLERQVDALRVRIIFATIQWGGAALLLWLFRPEAEVFFYWQVISLAATTFVLRHKLWRVMPHCTQSVLFDAGKLKTLWRFAVGTLAIGVTGSLLTQADKLLVAKYASLDQFAGYSLCFMVASLLSALLAQPVGAGLLPHFSALIAEGSERRLASEYHRWTQWIAVVAFPITAALVVFPQVLVYAWLPRESALSGLVITLLPWVALGTLLNVLSTLPYVLQMAAGRTRLLIIKNVLALAVVLPALVYGIPEYGPIAGAWCWLAVNAGYYVFEVPIMHQRILKNELWAWWFKDTLLPAFAVVLMFAVIRYFFSDAWGWSLVFTVAGATMTAIVLLAIILHYPREQLLALRFGMQRGV